MQRLHAPHAIAPVRKNIFRKIGQKVYNGTYFVNLMSVIVNKNTPIAEGVSGATMS